MNTERESTIRHYVATKQKNEILVALLDDPEFIKNVITNTYAHIRGRRPRYIKQILQLNDFRQENINLLVSTYHDNIDDIMDSNRELGSTDYSGYSEIDFADTIRVYLIEKEKDEVLKCLLYD